MKKIKWNGPTGYTPGIGNMTTGLIYTMEESRAKKALGCHGVEVKTTTKKETKK